MSVILYHSPLSGIINLPWWHRCEEFRRVSWLRTHVHTARAGNDEHQQRRHPNGRHPQEPRGIPGEPNQWQTESSGDFLSSIKRACSILTDFSAFEREFHIYYGKLLLNFRIFKLWDIKDLKRTMRNYVMVIHQITPNYLLFLGLLYIHVYKLHFIQKYYCSFNIKKGMYLNALVSSDFVVVH